MKAAVGQVREEYAFSQRRACGLMASAVSSYRYQARRSDEPLRTRLVELAREKPRFGYRRLHVLLRRSGEPVNHKRVHRVYREAGLSIRRKKRKHCVRVGQPLQMRTATNQEWALDFAHERWTADGRSGCSAWWTRTRESARGSSRNMSPKWVRNPPEVRPNAPEMLLEITQNRRQEGGRPRGSKHESD